MSGDVREADWKHLRALQPVALERYCARVLAELEAIRSDPSMTQHERYLAIWKLLKERDKALAFAFNEMSRSKAEYRIAAMRQLDLFTEEEFAGFSQATRNEVSWLVDRWGR